MISLVAYMINTFATTLKNLLLLASFTGKIIVSVVSWIYSVIFNSLLSILLFFQIVYEDNLSIFTEDIPVSINGLFDAIHSQLNYMHSGVSNFHNAIYSKCCAGLAGTQWLVRAVIMICTEVLILIKNAVIFIGDTVWLIVTFIPIHLPKLLRSALKHVGLVIKDYVIDAYMALLKVTNYLTEVPLQTFMGIVSTIVIVRLIVHFREAILTQIRLFYWSLIRNILYAYYVILNYFTTSDVAMMPRIIRGEDVGSREVTSESTEVISDNPDANNTDALCVICQERRKCVLTLPCRHVCLCAVCCRRLYGYQRTCPICRTFIYHSVTVYL